uniref:Uncharacterized protein n=1 Tax=uncultured marine group II/III euryarchaeote AD1000_09_E08 TaxID=1457711 RepID=A0A075FI56_9EURY|nr:hypothetical protein [uncultured marine group II/III euryarchaeote AD1000_09_E08]
MCGIVTMRPVVPLAIAVLLLSSLSGCIADGDGPPVEVSQEDLQYLFDENFEDFMNNTSITVNQEINHYNNTTIQQPSTLKSSSGTMAGVETVDMYPVGLALLVREDAYSAAAAGNSAGGLDGANICVGIGTVMEGELVDYFSQNNIAFTSVPVADSAEATAKFIDGTCDAMAIASRALADEKKTQLDDDGSMNGSMNEVGIWVAALYEGSTETPGVVGNSLSITIIQSSDEMIELRYLLAQVTLFATCPENATSTANGTGCNNIEQTFVPNGYNAVGIETICSDNVSFSDSNMDRFINADWNTYNIETNPFRGHGLDCTHVWSFHVSQLTGNIAGYDSAVHELSWGDWVYSAVWESTPIE